MQINCPILYRLMYISLTHNVVSLQNRDFKKPTEKVSVSAPYQAAFQLKQLPLHFNSTQSAVHFIFRVNLIKTCTGEGQEESKLCTT